MFKTLRGIQYNAEQVHDGYIIIRKEQVFKDHNIICLGYYYVFEARVFKAPSLRDLIKSRSDNIISLIQEMQNQVKEIEHLKNE